MRRLRRRRRRAKQRGVRFVGRRRTRRARSSRQHARHWADHAQSGGRLATDNGHSFKLVPVAGCGAPDFNPPIKIGDCRLEPHANSSPDPGKFESDGAWGSGLDPDRGSWLLFSERFFAALGLGFRSSVVASQQRRCDAAGNNGYARPHHRNFLPDEAH